MSKLLQWIVALAVSAVMMGYVMVGAARAQEAVGAWHGVLIAGPNVLRVVIHVKPAADGKLEGEFLSPDQSPRGFPLGEVKLAADRFSFSIPIIQGGFEGKWDPAKGAWVGQFKQGPVALPLTFEKGDLAAAPPSPAAAPTPPKPAAAPAAKTVEGVAVTGQSQTGVRSDIDRRSYDITRDLQAQTGSIADALRNIPSVQVDVQGNVSLRGDANVTIMIDGKPSSLFKGPQRGQILQQLPASSFERVEVMTNPSAAFRPDGSAGIINLIPKKARQVGKSGSVRATVGAGEKDQVGVNLSSVGKTLTLTGDLTWAHEKQSLSIQDKRSALDPLGSGFLPSAQTSALHQTVDVGVGRAAFDYDPDSRTRISGEVRGTGIRQSVTDDTQFSGLAPGGLVPEGFQRTGTLHISRDDVAVNGSWRRKLGSDPEHELVVDLTQERTTTDSRQRDQLVSTGPGLPSRAEDLENDATADQSHVKVDYTLPLPDNAKLKAGYELEYDRNAFDNTGLTGPTPATLALDATLTDHFRFHQAINGVYATYQHRLGEKLTALAGLRIEDTRIDLDGLTTGFRGSNDDTHLYPSLHLSWKESDADQITASYSQRITRPAPSDYDPFRIYQNPLNFRAGNPDLKPQQTHSFELAYQHRAGFTYYLATAFFRDNERGVTDVVTDLGGGVLLTTKQNLTRSRNGGLELVASGRFGSKITYGVSGSAFWNEIDATQLGFAGKRSDWSLNGQGAINYQATDKDFFQLIGQLTGKRLTPQGYHEPLGLMFVGYRHKFNNDWSLFVVGRDLANSYRDVLVIDTPRLHDRLETRIKLRAILVGVSYSFGSGAGRKDQGIDYGAGGAVAPR